LVKQLLKRDAVPAADGCKAWSARAAPAKGPGAFEAREIRRATPATISRFAEQPLKMT
jgi:hypothetical protein